VIPRDYTFLSTIKSTPESWHQIISTMTTRANQEIKPIDCLVCNSVLIHESAFTNTIQLFIPAVRVFAFTDTIPFHLQLRAPVASLRAFLNPTFVTRANGKQAPRPPRVTGTAPVVRVFLYRQIIVEVRGQRVWRYCVLGEGKLRAVPPSESPDDAGFATLDWEGEVSCTDNEKVGGVGGFNAGKLVVKVCVPAVYNPTLKADDTPGLHCFELGTALSTVLSITRTSTRLSG
jgi:hypothetical protein